MIVGELRSNVTTWAVGIREGCVRIVDPDQGSGGGCRLRKIAGALSSRRHSRSDVVGSAIGNTLEIKEEERTILATVDARDNNGSADGKSEFVVANSRARKPVPVVCPAVGV